MRDSILNGSTLLCCTGSISQKGIYEIEEVAGSGFRQFDVVTDYSDHHFFSNANFTTTKSKSAAAAPLTESFSNARSSVYKKIMQEWKILTESLPDTIYVRTYEARIDLLRAVIIGARGTPYHDGLFFFDISFPEDYPNTPPKVHYNSHGLRVNPNLYASGKVCLSLLNTWNGKKSEKWNPDCSSILQILVSIQALVLNAKPYYNEPGIKPAPNYKAYNEKVFVLTCKTMRYTLRNPPRHFKEFVTSHFSQRGCSILKAIDCYRNGEALVESYEYDKHKSLNKSKIFIKDLDEIYKLLFAEFLKIKAPGIEKLRAITESGSNGTRTRRRGCDKNEWNVKSSRDEKEEEKKKESIFGYLFNKVKKVLKIGDK